MQDTPLTLDHIVRRAVEHTSHVEIVTRLADRSLHRTTYGAVAARTFGP